MPRGLDQDRLRRDRVLFVSDVHLNPARPDVFLLFRRFLTEEAPGTKALYLLGDLFDFWVGRRQVRLPGFAEVLRRIRDLAESGTDVFFIQGNRDFMFDAGFAGAHGIKLLPDIATVTVGSKRVLLTHGDLLVTKDVAYHRMRRVIRSGPVRRILRSLPLSVALRLAGGFRRASGSEIRRKPAYVLEPDFEEMRSWLADGADALVFGHVHRGEQHRLYVDGRATDIFILGAWEDRPSYVEWDGEALLFVRYAPPLGCGGSPGTSPKPRKREVIAIDGPSGSGKSTVARRLARRMGYRFLDSGAMYRAAALLALRTGIDDADPAALERLLEGVDIRLDGERVLLDREDVSAEIRSPEVTRYVSIVAAVPEVRAAMVARQRGAYPGEDLVVEGRDIGSVVFPDAGRKIYLTATPGERARRRARETDRDPEEVRREQQERDARDRGREHSPLVRAEGAIDLLTDGLSIAEVVDRAMEIVGGEPAGSASRPR